MAFREMKSGGVLTLRNVIGPLAGRDFISIRNNTVLGVPILFVVGDDPASFMLIRSLLVSIICFAVPVPMFVPKFNGAKDKGSKRHVAYASSAAQSTSRGGNLGNDISTATTNAVTTGVGSITETS
jgi:hypothetical protein